MPVVTVVGASNHAFKAKRESPMTDRNCQYCAIRFSTTITRRVFCSDRCKTAYHREERLTCFYCGELGSTKDHLFPQIIGDGMGDTVRACVECNSTLNAAFATSTEERMKRLYLVYVKKYKLDQKIPEWSDDEISGLGPNLRTAVKGKIHKRQRALMRVLHIEARWKKLL